MPGTDLENFLSLSLNKYTRHLHDCLDFGNALPPTSSDDYPFVLLDKNNKKLIVSKASDIKTDFAWAKDPYNKLQKDIADINARKGQESMLWQLFRAQGGILVVCENGILDEKVLNTTGMFTYQRTQPTPSGLTMGALPIISLNANKAFQPADRKTLIHELAHNLCRSIGIQFDQSYLFDACLELECARNTSPLLNKHLSTLSSLTQKGCYETDEDHAPELFAMLMESRLLHPKEFAEQLPILDCFYKEYVYPTLSAVLNRQGKTLSFMRDVEKNHDSFTEYLLDMAEAAQRVRNGEISPKNLPNVQDLILYIKAINKESLAFQQEDKQDAENLSRAHKLYLTKAKKAHMLKKQLQQTGKKTLKADVNKAIRSLSPAKKHLDVCKAKAYRPSLATLTWKGYPFVTAILDKKAPPPIPQKLKTKAPDKQNISSENVKMLYLAILGREKG